MSWLGYLVAGFVLLIAVLWYIETKPLETQAQLDRMAEASGAARDTYSKQGKMAFIVGFTGEVGKELVKELVRSPRPFSKVALIGRRKVEFDDEERKSLDQKVVNFDKLDEFADEFKGFDVGFIAMGTTRGKEGATGFYKVDHDYVMNVAKLAKAGGTSEIHLVSSTGANIESSFLYQKTKGEVEAEIAALKFDRLGIYRPGLLLCNREETRFGEAIIRAIFKPISAVFPTSGSIPTSAVAKAMINNVVNPSNEKVKIFENKELHVLAGTTKK